MARSHVAAALAVASIVLLLTLQLCSQFGLPRVDFWRWTSDQNYAAGSFQIPLLPNEGYGSETVDGGDLYMLGVGKADITGPVVEINLMGYADPKQLGTGLRQRLYSRAFIVGDVEKTTDRFIYLVLDTQSGDTAIRYGILEGLQSLGPEYAVYGQHNVAVTGTHSHSGPGAWLNYLLPQITSKGFDKQSYHAIVDGALLSIQRAHRSLAPGRLNLAKRELLNSNINRSLYAYLANPEDERAKYEHSVDKELTLLRFSRAEDGKVIGALTWFPVHGTSMYGNNTLITGDNKGVAAYLLEESMGDGFVAGFSQANVGDTSPNILGAYCEDGSGEPCNFEDSTCNGRNEACHARGPHFGLNDGGTRSCWEIGRRQFQGARALLEEMSSPIKSFTTFIRGSTVRSLHTFADLSNFTFPLPNGSYVSTCPAALGYSFAAGTTDGPGAFDFKQNNSGSPDASPVWAAVSRFLHTPTAEQVQCQHPKPILLDVGSTTKPYLWTPNIVDIQTFRVGQLIIIVSPGEATTMAGRRWKVAVHDFAAATNLLSSSLASSSSSTIPEQRDDPVVVLGGPANSYTHYIATEEEYSVQRYEGASTLYGPHTLNAYINLTLSTLPYLSSSPPRKPLDPGPQPPIHIHKSLSFIRGVVYDRPPVFKSFGDLQEDVKRVYDVGETVKVVFVGSNPRNGLRLEGTFASVERMGTDGVWRTVRTDRDWELVFEWERKSTVLATSDVTISWETGMWDVDREGKEDDGFWQGRFRLRYFGDAKAPITGSIEAFEGKSGEFVFGNDRNTI